MNTSRITKERRGLHSRLWTRFATFSIITVFLIVGGSTAANASVRPSAIRVVADACTNSLSCFVPSGPDFGFFGGNIVTKISLGLAILAAVGAIISLILLLLNLLFAAFSGRNEQKRARELGNAKTAGILLIVFLLAFPALTLVVPLISNLITSVL